MLAPLTVNTKSSLTSAPGGARGGGIECTSRAYSGHTHQATGSRYTCPHACMQVLPAAAEAAAALTFGSVVLGSTTPNDAATGMMSYRVPMVGWMAGLRGG